MTDKQQRFIEEYTVDCNGAAAARRAGYSETSARQQASQLLADPEVATAISDRLRAFTMSADEAAKQISDIAGTRLNDYFVINKVLRTPTVRRSLGDLIQQIQAEFEFEERFADEAGLVDAELTRHQEQQKARQRQRLRYQIELEQNPDAFRDVNGEPVWVEEATIDLVALVKANERGRIKSLSYTEYGPKIELYGSDTALSKLLEYHGKIKAPNPVNLSLNITADDMKRFRSIFSERYQ